jgi:hypothetical protein
MCKSRIFPKLRFGHYPQQDGTDGVDIPPDRGGLFSRKLGAHTNVRLEDVIASLVAEQPLQRDIDHQMVKRARRHIGK